MKKGLFILIYLTLFSVICCTVSVQNVSAAGKPSYVGIEENDVLIWRVSIDEDPYEDYLEDSEFFTDGEIDDIIDSMFDDYWDEDVEGWKIVILEIRDEKEFEYNWSGTEENDQVPYLCNFYITEDYEAKDWEEEDMNVRGGVAKYDKDFYAYRTSYVMGLYYMVAANNINWKRVADEADEEFEDEWDGNDQDAGARVAKNFYKENGIITYFNPDEDKYDDFEAISQYNDDGVQMYYEWSYDGDPIIILELEGEFFYEYWEIILGVAILGVVVVVIIVVIVIKSKKHKEIKEKSPSRVEKLPGASTRVPKPTQLKYCPNCGTSVSSEDKFCNECGKKLF